jgi:hypothetical protein
MRDPRLAGLSTRARRLGKEIIAGHPGQPAARATSTLATPAATYDLTDFVAYGVAIAGLCVVICLELYALLAPFLGWSWLVIR